MTCATQKVACSNPNKDIYCPGMYRAWGCANTQYHVSTAVVRHNPMPHRCNSPCRISTTATRLQHIPLPSSSKAAARQLRTQATPTPVSAAEAEAFTVACSIPAVLGTTVHAKLNDGELLQPYSPANKFLILLCERVACFASDRVASDNQQPLRGVECSGYVPGCTPHAMRVNC